MAEERKRKMLGTVWPRKPDGETLPKPPPSGHRPPNRLIWGHGFDEFCWIDRMPQMKMPGSLVTMWSRSMIKEFGEIYNSDLEELFFDRPDVCAKPRLRRPWPVLKLPRQQALPFDAETGVIDEGSDHEEDRSWEAVLGDSDDEDLPIQINQPDSSEADSTAPKEADKHDGKPKKVFFAPYQRRAWASSIARKVQFNNPPKSRYIVNFPSLIPSDLDEDELSDSSDCSEPEKEARDPSDPLPFASSLLGHSYESTATVTEGAALVDEQMNHADRFSTKYIAPLEEHIPTKYFPDTLIVHDPENITYGRRSRHGGSSRGPTANSSNQPYLYRRLYPEADKAGSGSSAFPNIAHLHLASREKIGMGHHSVVYEAPLKLPAGLSTFKSSSARPGTVSVVAKVAFREREPRTLLENEGKVYNSFPRHLSEEYCGWHLLSPFMHSPSPSCALVPKFFGYYVPVDPDDMDKSEKKRPSWEKRSPILLIENCGTPIVAKRMDEDQRSECYSLLMRLHFEEYLHGSFHERNIVVQPGPLTVRPSERSSATPSYRVIDFGRTTNFETFLPNYEYKKPSENASDEQKKAHRTAAWGEFERNLGTEMRQTRLELGFTYVDAI